ncbi:Isochorismatase-like protein [Clohesyomyces aquaticus]|uniref:nicotinamidase n=1 Tax=Clohesyomyces aquaticus TaxID=1231657 RepID=A0A1Y1ZTM7_9PLEO|nr:Isochorismatase-like protein [Clohesyomyces aquaticus]
MAISNQTPQTHSLILINIQNDFITGSPNKSPAPSILLNVHQLLDQHEWPLIVASQDLHPVDHVSFASNYPGMTAGITTNISFVDTPQKTETQTLSADHCILGTRDAEIESSVQSRLYALEGYHTTVAYNEKAQNHSAFADNQYHRFMTLYWEVAIYGIETLVVVGLVMNACVRGTWIGGAKLGYEVVLVEDATESTTEMVKLGALE